MRSSVLGEASRANERDATPPQGSKIELDVLPGLRVVVPDLIDELGQDAGELFFHAGLTVIERAIATARQSPWWSGLPERIHRTLAEECERGLRMVELGERLQRAESDYFHELVNGRLDDELRARAAAAARQA